MAITKILRRKSRVDKLIAYALNSAKTENGSLTAHIHCSDGYAAQEMQSVRKNWDAEQGTQAFHIIQSFAPGEITPELALQLAQEFAAGQTQPAGGSWQKEKVNAMERTRQGARQAVRPR